MLDTTAYIDAQKSKLPQEIAARIAAAEVLHSSVALAEIAAGIGLLDPTHPQTAGVVRVLRETLDRADPKRTVASSTEAWLEASILAGILARTQGYAKESRRKLLNDALIFLSAHETGSVLISGNIKDMDLLLRMRPDVRIVLYDQT